MHDTFESLESRLHLSATDVIKHISLNGKALDVVAGQWIVQFDAPRATSLYDAVRDGPAIWRAESRNYAFRKYGESGIAIDSVTYLGDTATARFTVPTTLDDAAVQKALYNIPGVLTVEANVVGQMASVIPTDPYFAAGDQHWHDDIKTVDSSTQAGAWGFSQRGGSSSVVVAVLDSGVNYNHEDLTANLWRNTDEQYGTTGVDDDGGGLKEDYIGWDFIDGDNLPLDEDFHGTAVAGVLAAAAFNGKGVAGTAYGVKYMPIRISDPSGSPASGDSVFLANCISGINYVCDMRENAGANVRVINASFIFDTNTTLPAGRHGSLEGSMDRAESLGILFVAAAGNEGHDLDSSDPTLAQYPIGLNRTNHPNVLGVGASVEGSADTYASWANYSDTYVDMVAPGAGANYASPDFNGIFTTLFQLKADGTPLTGNNTYSEKLYNDSFVATKPIKGTSFATPMVSGTAALMLSLDPDLTFSQVKSMLMSSATHEYSGKVRSDGGRLNAYAALKAVSDNYARKDSTHKWVASILGDPGGNQTNDSFVIQQSGTTITVLQNGSAVFSGTVPTGQPLAIFGLSGNDSFTIQSSVTNPLYISGGEGTDTVTGSSSNDTLVSASSGGSLMAASAYHIDLVHPIAPHAYNAAPEISISKAAISDDRDWLLGVFA